MPSRNRFTEEQVERAFEFLKRASSTAPLTSEYLGRQMHLADIEGNWKARELISEVMRSRKVPIVARAAGKSRGYWIATSRNEIKSYVSDLYRRATEILGRAATVEGLWLRNNPAEQPEVDPSGDEY